MQKDNFDNHENLDDDIMQCRADILRSRSKAKDSQPSAQASEDNPFKRDDVTATRVNPFVAKKTDKDDADTTESQPAENKIRIPQFEELVASHDQVVEALWETPEKTEPKTDMQISQEETVAEIDQKQTQQQPSAPTGFDLDPKNIVTAEEEQALFDDAVTNDTEGDTQPLEEAAEQGLDDLRKLIEQAQNQAQPQIDELEDIEEIMTTDDIEQNPAEDTDETADIIEETGDNMNVTDLLESDQDQEEIVNKEIEPNSNEETTSDVIDENQSPDQSEKETNIPEFDLAEKILKEQRQVASRRRQRPTTARNLNVMPIAGTVGRIIEQAKKAVAAAAEKNETQPSPAADPNPIETEYAETESEKPVEFDTMEVVEINQEITEPVLSVAACRIINESDRLNPFQEDIIVDIVSKDIARFCGELTANC